MINKNIYLEKPDFNNLPGGWDLSDKKIIFPIESNNEYSSREIDILEKYSDTINGIDDILIIDNFLSNNEISWLIELINSSPKFENVGVQGMKELDEVGIGSTRTTIFSEFLSRIFTQKFDESNLLISNLTILNKYYPSDVYIDKYLEYLNYKFHAASPVFRCMKYKNGGEHYSHYDSGYIYKFNNDYRTLFSYVIYLTDNENGATRFIYDNQEKIPTLDRNHNDWTRKSKSDEIIFSSLPKKGSVLIFPHRLCHDVEQFFGEERIIIRGDLIYSK